MTEIYPRSQRFDFLLTAMTSVSHHDPAEQGDSNIQLFNRQKQLLEPVPAAAIMPTQAEIDALAERYPVPEDLLPIFEQLSLAEFCGVLVVKMFIDIYNSAEGTGLFSGMERYSMLDARLHNAAVRSFSLRAAWDCLVDMMRVPLHGTAYDAELLRLLALPVGMQQFVLRALVEQHQSTVAIARVWHDTIKRMSAAYTQKTGQPQASTAVQALSFAKEFLPDAIQSAQVVEVPAVSANSLRHQIVREPCWLHLCDRLGLRAGQPGQGPVPAGCEAVFYNGGNIASGAKQAPNAYMLAHRIRALYPSLDLLGGVTDTFDLGESKLRCAAYLVCAENRKALEGTTAYDLASAHISVFDMLDTVTMTRQGESKALGQMIFTAEMLTAGVQILYRMALAPQTARLTQGALLAGVKWWTEHDATIGGQAARGFGHCIGQWLADPDLEPLDDYEAYIAMQHDALIEGLVSGKLGCDVQVVS